MTANDDPQGRGSMHCDLSTSLPDGIIEYPQTAFVFDKLGLDAGSAGKSLKYLCLQQGIDPAWALNRLRHTVAASRCARPAETE